MGNDSNYRKNRAIHLLISRKTQHTIRNRHTMCAASHNTQQAHNVCCVTTQPRREETQACCITMSVCLSVRLPLTIAMFEQWTLA